MWHMSPSMEEAVEWIIFQMQVVRRFKRAGNGLQEEVAEL